VDLEVLNEIVTPAKVLSTGGDDTFVRFFVCMDRPNVSFEVLPPEETLSASKDIASEHPSLRRRPAAELISLRFGRDPPTSTLLDEIGNGDGRFLVLVKVHVGVRRVVGGVTGQRGDGSRKVRVGHEV